jgi:hypothetical protein
VDPAGQVPFSGQQRLDRTEQRDPDEGNDLRPVAPDLSIECLPAFHVLRRREVVDTGTWPRNQVRDAEPELRQHGVVDVRNGLGDETGSAQELPEAVRVAREVMTRLRGPHAGIDPHEQHAHAGPDSVGQAKM